MRNFSLIHVHSLEERTSKWKRKRQPTYETNFDYCFTMFQMRYQQKQKEEMDRKRNELGSRAASSPFDLNDNNRIQIGNGKVILFLPNIDHVLWNIWNDTINSLSAIYVRHNFDVMHNECVTDCNNVSYFNKKNFYRFGKCSMSVVNVSLASIKAIHSSRYRRKWDRINQIDKRKTRR